jgi:DNA polymerase-3 subunit gamma/tau
VEEAAPAAAAPPVPETLEEAWKHILEAVHQNYPLYEEWLLHGALLELTGQTAKIGLPTTESMARESLLRPASKAKVEECIAKVLQRPVKIEVVLDPSLKPPPATEMSFGLNFGDSAPPPPKEAPAATAAPAPEAPKEPEGVAADPEFYNDPLIQAAIVKFKATLVK